MGNYDVFAEFYDSAMGNRSRHTAFVETLIKKHNPKAGKVLELACGTGAILKPLSGKYEVSGLDISKGMLAKAVKKLPKAKFYRQSMAGFKINKKFDVILCLFDSINHLLTFKEWKKVFVSAEKHLNEGGLFVFDMNTRGKLKVISSSRPAVLSSGKDLTIMDVASAGGELTDWKITVFKHIKEDVYERHDDMARETSFPIKAVKRALAGIYGNISMTAAEKKWSKSGPGRVYFCCKKEEGVGR